MDKDVLVDRSHRTTQPMRPDGKPNREAALLSRLRRDPAPGQGSWSPAV